MTDLRVPHHNEPAASDSPMLPNPRGELSALVLGMLREELPAGSALLDLAGVDPYGDDLQVALHLCYELHYHGYAGVSAEWEWAPELLRVRASLERHFLDALRREVTGGADVDDEMGELLAPSDGGGVGDYLRDEGGWTQVLEYFVHRSMYHHKEADPYVWAIPRLSGQAKASLVAVEFDEFGGGHAERVHARLYADLLHAAGLDDGYLHYFDSVPAPMLAIVNMMSLFGLHRNLRGALVGHFATVEITSPPASRQLVEILEKFGAAPECIRFYTEHVEADAVHEQVMRRDVIADMLAREPELAESMVLGIQVTNLLEDRLASHLLESWQSGLSSLLTPLAVG
ncbi:iron-containing redox enzyme family protein [Nocardia callitridis]|uniref:Iron-containing redox enzyme family protein n=1 Tax=Nocardia callitridis TaxID=648753 RepID=A0ABP9KRS2_9NOCA